MKVRTGVVSGGKQKGKEKRKAVTVLPIASSPSGMNSASREYHAAHPHELKHSYNPFVNPYSAVKQVGKNPTADGSGSFGGGM